MLAGANKRTHYSTHNLNAAWISTQTEAITSTAASSCPRCGVPPTLDWEYETTDHKKKKGGGAEKLLAHCWYAFFSQV